MRRKREEQSTDSMQAPKTEHIGHITTPIDDKDLQRVQTTCKQHSITMIVCQTDATWWTLLLPQGTTKTATTSEGKAIAYTVQLPDGTASSIEHQSSDTTKTTRRCP